METLKYKLIKSESQYYSYCEQLETLVFTNEKTKNEAVKEEIELLTMLIEKWDEEHNSFENVDPITVLHSLMLAHEMKAKTLAEILGVSKSLVSEILSYKKGLSKEIIRVLASYFKLSQEAFNRPYKLKVPENKHLRNASVMNTMKKVKVA